MRTFFLILLTSVVGLAHGRSSFPISLNAYPQISLSNGRNGDGVKTTAQWGYPPDPPKPGQDLTIIAKGTALRRIEDGAFADVLVKVGLIKVINRRFDICEEARKANASVTCPIEEGEYEVKQTVRLPREIPPAKFTVEVHGYTVDDGDMLCLKLNADFRP
ncbi:hypothetical protein MVEN_01292900 [Mycena venus]|uniref:Phosphatidylglycerol/phosphatidylinositol transfer protein n=1 Tax=Mycena venus TaxID=2733690 RepID=A0A8H6XZH4_9AGAR|nr:hypothetical protein MVEN_01292900 [Mycena venus]